MKIGKYEFDVTQAYIMGILNITPNSFSDGGKWNKIDKALIRVEQMINDGATVIDVGGESTRPGYEQIADKIEIERIVPVIEAICKRFDIPVSVDTYKSTVAKEALKAGASVVNDIWGFKYDKKMAEVVAKYKATCCLMHNKTRLVYENFIEDVISEILESVEIAKLVGISAENIIIDPGIGFGKTQDMNLSVIKHLDRFCSLGYPVLLGCSRKSIIGNVLQLPVNQRLEGTLSVSAIAVMHGCTFLRVHDVRENFLAARMATAIKRGE